MSEVDYYKVLGVSKTATQKDIKKAFRKLVRKYHPDVSTDPHADDIIANINNAYEVLSDEDLRAEYDRNRRIDFTRLFKDTSDRFTDTKPTFHWDDLKDKFGENSPFASNSFSFDDILSELNAKKNQFNSSDKNPFKNKQYSDIADFFNENINKHKKNKNHVHNHSSDFDSTNKGSDQELDINLELASAYHGSTFKIKLSVPTQMPSGGLKYQEKLVEVAIPKGIINKQQIRVDRQGSASLYGGENGDLVLTVNLTASDNIYVKENDVYQKITIMPWDAALGAVINIDTPAGTFDITIPEESHTNDKLRIKGKGIPSDPAGDLFIVLHIDNPLELTSSQKKLLQSLKENCQ